jgi:signal transduction histidine kinase
VEPLVRQAIHDAGALLEPTDPPASITTAIEVAADARTIDVDPQQFARVFRNLVGNAMHAMPQGGSLAVTCRRDGGGWTIISITDTGVGISPELAKHLFEPFHSTKRFGAGTGLGLAISKQIVERHGGSIGVSSEPERGTTVTIRLPDESIRGGSRGTDGAPVDR